MFWLSVFWVLLCVLAIQDGGRLGRAMLLPAMPNPRDRAQTASGLCPNPYGILTYLGLCVVLLYLMTAAGHQREGWRVLALPVSVVTLALSLREAALWLMRRRCCWRRFCEITLFVTAMVASAAQGAAFGVLAMHEVVVQNTWVGWSSPLALLAAVTFVLGHAFVGALRIWLRSSGALERRMRHFATALGLGTLAVAVMLGLIIPERILG